MLPAPAGVELTDEREQARGRRLKVRRELGDLITQAIQLREVRGCGLRRLQPGVIIGWVYRHGESPFLLGRLYTHHLRLLGTPPGRDECRSLSTIARLPCR